MTDEIPEQLPQSFVEQFIAVRDMNLAAMLLSDDRVPRLDAADIRKFYEGESRAKPLYLFRFASNDRSAQLYAEWKKVAAVRGDNNAFDSVSVTYRAFQNCETFIQIIKDGNVPRRPTDRAGVHWTVNTKAAATALALAAGSLLPKERLRGLVYRDGSDYGFLLLDATVIKAFEEPTQYIAAHPDAALSYVVGAFFLRERLRDLVNQWPAQHIFRKPETNEVYLVVEPQKQNQPKEIPAHA
jgi:hypothetical protein